MFHQRSKYDIAIYTLFLLISRVLNVAIFVCFIFTEIAVKLYKSNEKARGEEVITGNKDADESEVF